MAQIKTSELEGAALDWAVLAATEGNSGALAKMRAMASRLDRPADILGGFHPSTDWSRGGPLIEKHKIRLAITAKGEWYATTDGYIYGADMSGLSPSLLVAAMRAIVASKIGDTVEIPEKLL